MVLEHLGLAALSIDPETLKASRPVDPLPLPSLDSAKGLSTVDWTSRPPHVRPWYLRSWQGAAAARRPCRLEVRPGVVPDVLERAVELGPAPADKVRRLQRPTTAAAVQHNARAHTLRTPKHGSHYHYGRRCGRHSPC